MIRRELTFLLALWKANLLKHMEYRTAFLTGIIGMFLNNGVYFLFWVLFFDRFKEIRGWALPDMLLLCGIVATGFGIGAYLFGNVLTLAEVISQGLGVGSGDWGCLCPCGYACYNSAHRQPINQPTNPKSKIQNQPTPP